LLVAGADGIEFSPGCHLFQSITPDPTSVGSMVVLSRSFTCHSGKHDWGAILIIEVEKNNVERILVPNFISTLNIFTYAKKFFHFLLPDRLFDY